MNDILLTLYCVINNEGKYYKREWIFVDDIKKAKLFHSISPARSRITRYSRSYKNKEMLKLVTINITNDNLIITEEKDRVIKSINKIESEERARKQYYKEHLKQQEINQLRELQNKYPNE